MPKTQLPEYSSLVRWTVQDVINWLVQVHIHKYNLFLFLLILRPLPQELLKCDLFKATTNSNQKSQTRDPKALI